MNAFCQRRTSTMIVYGHIPFATDRFVFAVFHGPKQKKHCVETHPKSQVTRLNQPLLSLGASGQEF